jgi:hypothetical protein
VQTRNKSLLCLADNIFQVIGDTIPFRLIPTISEALCELVIARDALGSCNLVHYGLLRGDTMSSWNLVQRAVQIWSSGIPGMSIVQQDRILSKVDTWVVFLNAIFLHLKTFNHSYKWEHAVDQIRLCLDTIMQNDITKFVDVALSREDDQDYWMDFIVTFLSEKKDWKLVANALHASRFADAPPGALMLHIYKLHGASAIRDKCFEVLVQCRHNGHLLDDSDVHTYLSTLKLACVRGDVHFLHKFASRVGVGEKHWIELYKNHASCPTQEWMRQTLSLGSDPSFRESVQRDLALTHCLRR